MIVDIKVGSTSVSPMPTHRAGDLLYAVTWNLVTGGVTAPAGWQLITSFADDISGNYRNRWHYYKVATSDSETSGTWTGAALTAITSIRNVRSPYYGFKGKAVTYSDTTQTLPAVTQTYPNSALLIASGRHSVGGLLSNNPTGMTELYTATTDWLKQTPVYVGGFTGGSSFTASASAGWGFVDIVEFPLLPQGALFWAFP